jgi:hypothetical protein
VTVHRRFRGFDLARAAAFHLDEAQNIAIPSNEINFASAEWRAKVAGNDHIAELSQVEVGIFFPPPANLLMSRSHISR